MQSRCNSGGNDTGDAGASSSGEEVTLKVWESVDGPDKWIQQAGEKFTEQNPNIKIEFVNVELGDSASAIALDGPAGTGPDLFAAPHDKLGELVVGGHILPTVGADKVKGEVLGSCSQALTYEGTMYGYPASAETYALFYNRALISDDEVPKNWDDLYTWGQSFRDANPDKYPIVMDVTSIADGMPVKCIVSMVEPNYIDNYSFEGKDYSMWNVINVNDVTTELDFQEKSTDAKTGSFSFHFYSENKVDFKLEQTVTNLKPGAYNFSLSLQGGDCANDTMYIYAIADGKEYTQETGVVGWANWQSPSIKDITTESGEITVGIAISCDPKGWRTIDDVLLNPVEK